MWWGGLGRYPLAAVLALLSSAPEQTGQQRAGRLSGLRLVVLELCVGREDRI